MDAFSHVPPGFRFHPTDEELVDYYLQKKVTSRRIDLDVIRDVDLYKIEPWDLDDLCKSGHEEQNEWFFFSHKDKKYPTGTRTNRATTAGFWKATGRDKAIYSKNDLIGMRKTLVFYKGRAPNGQKSDYIMHEYRLETDENGPTQEEGWVVCRVFKKRLPTMRRMGEHDTPMWYDDQVSFMPNIDSPKLQQSHFNLTYQFPYSCKKELEMVPSYAHHITSDQFLQLPVLENTKSMQPPPPPPPPTTMSYNSLEPPPFDLNVNRSGNSFQATLFAMHDQQNLPPVENDNELATETVTDWRVLDKFVASQLSQEDGNSKETDYSNAEHSFNATDDDQNIIARNLDNEEMATENASTLSSSFLIDMWK